jgi:hypothetical protein
MDKIQLKKKFICFWTAYTRKIEAADSSETGVTIYQYAWRHITKDLQIHQHRCKDSNFAIINT